MPKTALTSSSSERIFEAPKFLFGLEIETAADYIGQGELVVVVPGADGTQQVKYLTEAYDRPVASSKGKAGLSITMDSNRDIHSDEYPKRTCLEFRSNPGAEANEALLKLVKAYSTWLVEQKKHLKKQVKEGCVSFDEERQVYINFNDFITYYNRLEESAENQLTLVTPNEAKISLNGHRVLSFPETAFWGLAMEPRDLKASLEPIFVTQYNLCLPLACIYEPSVKRAFPLMSTFVHLEHEKEKAPYYNECRPHEAFMAYEDDVFTQSVEIADAFFDERGFPETALGLKGFLRAMTFQIMMAATSQREMEALFEEEARLIFPDVVDRIKKGAKLASCTEDEVKRDIAGTVERTLFPYSVKLGLAEWKECLHPEEKKLLATISCADMLNYAMKAKKEVHGSKHSTCHFWVDSDFKTAFNIFYAEVFKGKLKLDDEVTAEPMGYPDQKRHFIKPVDLIEGKITGGVVEIRRPEQGDQTYSAIEKLAERYKAIHQEILDEYIPTLLQAEKELATPTRHAPSKKTQTASTKKMPVLAKVSMRKAKKELPLPIWSAPSKKTPSTKKMSVLAKASMRTAEKELPLSIWGAPSKKPQTASTKKMSVLAKASMRTAEKELPLSIWDAPSKKSQASMPIEGFLTYPPSRDVFREKVQHDLATLDYLHIYTKLDTVFHRHILTNGKMLDAIDAHLPASSDVLRQGIRGLIDILLGFHFYGERIPEMARTTFANILEAQKGETSPRTDLARYMEYYWMRAFIGDTPELRRDLDRAYDFPYSFAALRARPDFFERDLLLKLIGDFTLKPSAAPALSGHVRSRSTLFSSPSPASLPFDASVPLDAGPSLPKKSRKS